MHIILAILLAGIGLFCGAILPDTDQVIPLLIHRSVLTHGFLIPLGLCLLAERRSALRLFVIGVCAASAVHLAYDLFPRAWSGYALVTVPFVGRTSSIFSWLWLALSLVVCLYLPLRWVTARQDLIVITVCIGVAFLLAGALLSAFAKLFPALALLAGALVAIAWAARENATVCAYWSQFLAALHTASHPPAHEERRAS